MKDDLKDDLSKHKVGEKFEFEGINLKTQEVIRGENCCAKCYFFSENCNDGFHKCFSEQRDDRKDVFFVRVIEEIRCKEKEETYKFVKYEGLYRLIDIDEAKKYKDKGYKVFKAEKIKFDVNLESYIEEALERYDIDLDELEIDRKEKKYIELKANFDNYLQSIANNFYNVGDEENV